MAADLFPTRSVPAGRNLLQFDCNWRALQLLPRGTVVVLVIMNEWSASIGTTECTTGRWRNEQLLGVSPRLSAVLCF